MEDGFSMTPDLVTEDGGDMTRLMLQHCVMPAYQFILQVAPDQTSVTCLSFLVFRLILCSLSPDRPLATSVTPALELLQYSNLEASESASLSEGEKKLAHELCLDMYCLFFFNDNSIQGSIYALNCYACILIMNP